jgi:uncharacterized protein (DUF433 family)
MRKGNTVVARSPEILQGSPVFSGTRVPIEALIDYLEAGDRIEDFLDDFPTVSREQAVAALELAKETLLQSPATGPRVGWADAARRARKRGDDRLV